MDIFYRTWIPDSEAQGAVLLVHGLGDHSGRMKNIALHFANQNYLVRAFDLIGHGQSTGSRGHCSNLQTYLNQIDLAAKDLKHDYPELPLILYGQSMGGNLVLNYLFRYKPHVEGVIITSPWIKVFREYPSWIMYLLRKIHRIWPTLTLRNQLDINEISRDPQEVKAYKTDPLNHNKISLSLGIAMVDAAKFLQKKHSSPVNILLMHGEEDHICLPIGSEIFVSNFEGDLCFRTWPHARHELHHDPDKEAILEFASDWVNDQIIKVDRGNFSSNTKANPE